MRLMINDVLHPLSPPCAYLHQPVARLPILKLASTMLAPQVALKVVFGGGGAIMFTQNTAAINVLKSLLPLTMIIVIIFNSPYWKCFQ